ncbi:transposase [Mammaliicoccus lentus]|uniref:transposase n=1 Tax=Mammaliicoccus lentus TaxID=42858 RepID=UPI00351228DF
MVSYIFLLCNRTRYSEYFKEMIVDLANNGSKVKGLKSEYGISEATIYKWKKLYIKNAETGISEKQMQTLRKENKQLKMENEILKKEVMFFISSR